MPTAPLDGVLVADFSRILAGPLCTQVLADLGADVVKVERPDGGDDTRGWGPSYFLGLNRGKRSVALDLKDPGDVELARELIRRADVVVESFRPGVMERLGLGRELNPRRRVVLDHRVRRRATCRATTCCSRRSAGSCTSPASRTARR